MPVSTADLYVKPVQETKFEVVRPLIRKDGVPEGLLTGCWDEIRGVMRGSVNYGRY